MNFGSLFSGIGGIDLGLERAGMTCKWQVEIDDYATRVLEKHWPGVARFKDIKTVGKSELGKVDLIAGGFPCQDISYAGAGAGLSGERSGLFYELVRIVRELEPRFVLLENVSALLTRGLDDVLGTLASIGFNAEWHCLQAANFGAPHLRDRIFIVGYSNTAGKRAGRKTEGWKPFKSDKVGQWLEQRRDDGRSEILADTDLQGPQRRQETGNAKKSRTNREQQFARQGERDDRHNWEAEPAVCRVANGIPHRVDRLRGLGNAVVPQISQWIGERIINEQV